MVSPFRLRPLTRRGFLTLAGAAGAVLGFGVAASGAAEAAPAGWLARRRRKVYGFDPGGYAGRAACCDVCQRHAAHKRFASFALADARRAHPGCRCAIRAERVPYGEYVRLFGAPGTPGFRTEHDGRWRPPA